MVNIIKRIFSVNYMLKSSQRTDEGLPASKEIYKIALKTAWPSIVETFLVGLIGLMDTVMVGALGGTLGDDAIAGVGITGQPRMILLACVFSLNIGVTAVVARRRGEENSAKASETLMQSLIVCFFIVIVMGFLGFVFARPLMLFAGAKENTQILDFSVQYFRITSIGFVFSSLGMVINAAQRGAGNTRISMYTNITANTINLVFNYLLINGNFGFPRLMVAGAAIATVMGNFVMFVICVLNVTVGAKEDRFLKLKFKISNLRLRAEALKGVANVSLSAFVEQICMRIGFFAYARLVAGLDSPTVPALATYTICMTFQNMSFTFGDGLSIASSSLVGRSLGAKRADLAIVFGKTAQRLSFLVSIVLFFIFMSGRYFFMGLFTETEAVIEMGVIIIILIAVSSPFQLSQVVFNGCLRGAGDTKFVAGSSFISITFIRPIVTWFLCYPLGLGLTGAWLSLIFDQIVRLILAFWRFTKGEWTKKKV